MRLKKFAGEVKTWHAEGHTHASLEVEPGLWLQSEVKGTDQKAKLQAAQKVLRGCEAIMAKLTMEQTLAKIDSLPPKEAGRFLLVNVGKNAAVDKKIIEILRTANAGNKRSAAVRKWLAGGAYRILIRGEVPREMQSDFEVGFLAALPAALPVITGIASVLPDVIKGASSLLGLSKSGDEQATQKVRTTIQQAEAGNPQAKAELNNLQDASLLSRLGINFLPKGLSGAIDGALGLANKASGGLLASGLTSASNIAHGGLATANTLANAIPLPPGLDVVRKIIEANGGKVVLPTDASAKKLSPAEKKAAAKKKAVENHEPFEGQLIPSWETREGKAVRAAPNTVLVKMDEAAANRRPYGRLTAENLIALHPLIVDEMKHRGLTPRGESRKTVTPSVVRRPWYYPAPKAERIK